MAITAEELRVLISAQDNASDTLMGLANVMDGLGTSAMGMGDNIFKGVSKAQMALMGLGAMAGVGIAYSVYQAAQFEKEMQIVSAVSGVTGDELNSLGNEAKALGQKYGVSATEMAQGLQVLGRAGVEAGVQLDVLNSALEMVSLEDMPTEQASENLVNIIKMYGDSLENAGMYSDTLIHASMISTASIEGLMEAFKFAGGGAKTLGWDVRDLTAALATLIEQGLDPSMAGTAMRAFQSIWTKDADVAKKAAAGLQEIGLSHESFIDSDGKAIPILEAVDKLYGSLSEKFGSVKEHGVEWTQVLGKIFIPAQADKLTRLFTGMEEGQGLLSKYTGQMNENFDATKAVETAQQGLSNTLKRTWVAFQNLAINVGTGFLPILRVLAGGLEEVTKFLSENEWATMALAGGLTILAGAALLTAAAWGKNLIIGTLNSGYDILRGIIPSLIGQKALETSAVEKNTLAWVQNALAIRGANSSIQTPVGSGFSMLGDLGGSGPRQGGYLQRAGALGSGFIGSLGSIEALGTSIPLMIPVLVGVAAAAAAVYLWFSHLDGVYERVGKKVEELRGDEKRLTDRLHEQREALKGVKEGTKAYDDLNAALQVTQQELDKVIDKIYQQNAAMYAAEASDPRKMLSAESGATEPMILQQAGSGPFGIGVGFVQQGIGQSLGYSSNVIGAQEEYLQSYQKWATPTVEHQLQAAYKYMSDASNLALLQKQKDNPNSLTDEDKRNIEQIDNYLKGIVGKDNVKGAKDMYFAELKLAEARKKLDDAMGRLWMSVINLVLAFFGLGGETTDETGKQKDLGAQMSETADKINKASEKVYNLIDAIDQFIKNVDWWIQELQGKHPDTPQETQAKNVLNTGQPNANPSTNVVGIPNVPTTPVWDPLAQIRQNSPLVISKGKPGQLNQGTTEIRLPDVDPDRFAKERAETKKALLSKGGGGNNYTIIVYANTKKDADAVGQKVRETLENLNK